MLMVYGIFQGHSRFKKESSWDIQLTGMVLAPVAIGHLVGQVLEKQKVK